MTSKLYHVRGVDGWYMDQNGLAAIGVRPECTFSLTRYEEDNRFVAVGFGEFVLLSCYFSPNRDLRELEEYLAKHENSIEKKNANGSYWLET